MRAEAQGRSSAANSDGSASRGSVFGRRSAATRASSHGSDGRGAPSHRGRLTVLALAIASLALLAFAPLAQAEKVVANVLGPAGTKGGEIGFFSNPSNLGARGIAVNTSGNGASAGTVYVVEEHNDRVQRLGPDGDFELAWGWNVVQSGRPDDRGASAFEICTIAEDCQAGATSPASANGGMVIDGQGVDVDQSNGHVYISDSARRISEFDADGAFVRTWGWDVITRGRAGNVAQNEIQTVSLNAGITGGTFTLRFGGTAAANTSTAIDWDADATEVRAALETIAALTGNVDVTSANPGGGVLGGPWTVEFRGTLADTDVAQMTSVNSSLIGSPRTITIATTAIGGQAFEICTVPADCKTAAAAGFNGGQFGSSFPPSLKLDSSGDVWVADSANRRLQQFDDTGNLIAARGYGVNGGSALESCASTAAGVCRQGIIGSGPGQFGNTFSPQHFDFDSAGNILANNSANGRIERFDPAFTTASTFATVPDISGSSPLIVLPGDGVLFGASVSGEIQLHELDSAGAPFDTHLAGLGISQLRGMVREPAGGAIYVTVSGIPDTAFGILKLDDPPGTQPEFTFDPVTVIGDVTATFSGAVDPRGNNAPSCIFQYSTDKSTWTDVPAADCASLDNDGGSQSIDEDVTGLVPNTDYFVRLVVRRQLVDEELASGLRGFRTLSVPPVVSNVGAVDVQDTSVRMVGTIDPRNSETGYVFEYGTTPALGSSTAPVAIGGGTTPLIVSQPVGGLSPDTTYYFRLVATNEFGETRSSSRNLTTRADAVPAADARAYEQVSPVEKSGGGAIAGGTSAVAAGYDGNGVGFCTYTIVGDPGAPFYNPLCGVYAALRGAGGWQSKPAHPPACVQDPKNPTGSATSLPVNFSRDFDLATIGQPEFAECPLPLLDPAASQPGKNLYLSDLSAASPGYQLLSPELGFPIGGQVFTVPAGSYAASSDDFTHIVYSSSGQQLGGGPGDGPAGDFDKLYEWDNGTLRLVSVDPDEVPFGNASQFAASNRSNGVSADGSRIFFQNASPVGFPFPPTFLDPAELYMREGGTRTHWVSEQECDPACSDRAGADDFAYATPDGRNVLFTTTGQRTDDDTSSSGDDLYLYTHSDNPATDDNLTLLSQDNEVGDGTSAAVQGVLGASDDGETVFFAANGQIVAGEETASGPKLYRWTADSGSPSLEYLATLIPARGAGVPGDTVNWDGSTRQVTPTGEALLLTTTVQLDPVADQDADQDIYRWSEASGWTCVSCQLPGTPSAGESGLGGIAPGVASTERQINISDDGSRVFFQTQDALVPEDVNGNARDVYEWHDGRITMISSGTDPGGTPSSNNKQGVNLIGASHDGRDVFFLSDEQLVGWDTDFANDIYNARIGGGFPEPPPTGVPCEGDACRGAGSSSPEIAGAGTRAFEGQGNPPDTSRACNRFSKKAKRKLNVAKRAAKRGQAKRARALRKQARNLNRRAKRCNRRQGR